MSKATTLMCFQQRCSYGKPSDLQPVLPPSDFRDAKLVSVLNWSASMKLKHCFFDK